MKCSFCSRTFPSGRGKLFVKVDGKVLYFCSNKCEKNMLKLGRNPRTTRWTGEAHRIKKESAGDKKAPKKK
ncbi:MAG: 50S ribosomal protein L24e [Candidatus Nanoarchaeia archaeon]